MEELVVIKQIPQYEEQLREMKVHAEQRIKDAVAMACTEETLKDVKKIRSENNKEFAELEAQRKAVKSAVMSIYDRYESVYNDCVGNAYKAGDKALKDKIDEVENALKAEIEKELVEYFNEYRATIGLDEHLAPFSASGIKITRSASMNSMKKSVVEFLDGCRVDIDAIGSMDDAEEVITEYLITRSLARAVGIVQARHELIAQERARRESRPDKKEEAPVVEEKKVEQAPVVVKDEPVYEVQFKVRGNMESLKKLKKFLVDGGYEYESD